MKPRLIVAIVLMGVLTGVSPNSSAADFSDTTPPLVTIEEVTGVNPDLNIVLFKIQAQDNANVVSLRDCNAGSVAPNCMLSGNFTFLSQSQIPPSNIAPICTTENLTRRFVVGALLASNSQSVPANSAYKHSSIFYVALTKPAFEKVPDGCPQWRNDSRQTFIKDRRFSIPTVTDEAGNATEVPFWNAFQKVSTLPTSALGMCFIGGEPLNLSRSLTSLSNSYENFTARFETNSQFSVLTKNSTLEKYEEQLKNSKQYAKFYLDSFEPKNLNALPICRTRFFSTVVDLALLNADIANEITVLSSKLSEIAENENRMKAEAKAKQEADAKAAAELKAKQDADAKAAAANKTTITCVKGKLTKKVTAVKPKCPSGYKVKK